MPTCATCSIEMPAECFHADRTKKSGVSSRCKPCVKSYRRAYYAAHAEKAKADSLAYYFSDPKAHREKGDAWKEKNRERHLAYRSRAFKNRYRVDALFALNCRIRSMLKRTLASLGKPKDFATFQKIGYTAEMLRARIEMNFLKGMNWANAGEWEIDHRVPISRMLAKGETRPEVINCLANLKPLWVADNRSKGARYAS